MRISRSKVLTDPPGFLPSVAHERKPASESGDARLVRGTPEDLRMFFRYFDPPSGDPIPLTVR